MAALDRFYTELVEANPDLRARVGNPDELASNRLGGVLKALKHRVSEPESELESVSGRVITALNEEAVVSACLANQGGLNLVASYEAFCVKMLGAVRQTLIFARQQKEVGRPAGWLGWPLVATSHTWENGKNQQSHQDTTFCEALLGEMSDMVRVLFPADHNSALALLPTIYRSRGQLACLVIPKRDRPMVFDAIQAERLARDGAILVEERCGSDPLLLIANGSYQLEQMRRAAQRLAEAGQAYRLVYLQEPGRFRAPRDRWEVEAVADEALVERLFPDSHERRVLLTPYARGSGARSSLADPAGCPAHLGTRLSQPRRHPRRGGHAVRQPRLLGQRAGGLRPLDGGPAHRAADPGGSGGGGRQGRSGVVALSSAAYRRITSVALFALPNGGGCLAKAGCGQGIGG